MNEQIGSTVKIEIADSVNCVSCGKQVYATETPYVCHDCWKSGKIGKYIATQAAAIEAQAGEIKRLREILQHIYTYWYEPKDSRMDGVEVKEVVRAELERRP